VDHTSLLLQVIGQETMQCIDSHQAVTSAIGTNRTSIDVRSSVAIGGKPDMAPKLISEAIEPGADVNATVAFRWL